MLADPEASQAAPALQAPRPDALLSYARRPLALVGRYARRRGAAHAVVVLSVVAAVACSVGSQYAVKQLVDALSGGPEGIAAVWTALVVLGVVVAGDNLLWRVGGWVATGAFTGVTRDLRADLFRHLTGHAPDFFADRSPGALASRVSAAGNGAWTVLSTFCWNTLPPCLAVALAIVLMASVDATMAAVLFVASAAICWMLARLAARGRPLHADYASRAAGLDGELVDVVQNVGLVRAFGATLRECDRFGSELGREVEARRRSLRYLEKLRLLHAVITAVMTVALLAWAVLLWQAGRASTGDVVMICGLGLTILHGTRDLAVALVDMTQHVARLADGVAGLLVPHALPDAPDAQPLRTRGGRIDFDELRFGYPGAEVPVLRRVDLRIRPGERVGLVGHSGAGKSTVLALLQRFAAPSEGRIMIDSQDIASVTKESSGRCDRGGAPGCFDAAALGAGEHPLRPPRRDRRGGAGRGRGGALPGFHRGPPSGFPHRGGAAGCAALGGAAAADRHCTSASQGCSHPSARRGDQRPGQRSPRPRCTLLWNG